MQSATLQLDLCLEEIYIINKHTQLYEMAQALTPGGAGWPRQPSHEICPCMYIRLPWLVHIYALHGSIYI